MTGKIYIIGKITGLDYYQCWRKFEQRENQLLDMGYRVVNPMRLVPKDTEWITAMKICIAEMTRCHGVSPLPDTWDSKGALIEFNLSRMLEMPIVIPEEPTYRLDKENINNQFIH